MILKLKILAYIISVTRVIVKKGAKLNHLLRFRFQSTHTFSLKGETDTEFFWLISM